MYCQWKSILRYKRHLAVTFFPLMHLFIVRKSNLYMHCVHRIYVNNLPVAVLYFKSPQCFIKKYCFIERTVFFLCLVVNQLYMYCTILNLIFWRLIFTLFIKIHKCVHILTSCVTHVINHSSGNFCQPLFPQQMYIVYPQYIYSYPQYIYIYMYTHVSCPLTAYAFTPTEIKRLIERRSYYSSH